MPIIAPPTGMLIPRKIKGFGCIPDQPNKHTPKFSLVHADLLGKALPLHIDLWDTGFMPAIWNQGNLGSCTAHGIGRAFEFLLKKQGVADFMPSRLELYYHERKIEGTIDSDAGAQIADGITVLKTLGVGHENLWPYSDSDVPPAGKKLPLFMQQPPTPVEKDARLHKITQASSVQTLDEMRANLAAGFPVVLGISVHQSFESPAVAQNGLVPMPTAKDPMIGGHCICATGYDDTKKLITCDNSWSDQWAVKGRFYLPYAYIQDPDLTSDMWSFRAFVS